MCTGGAGGAVDQASAGIYMEGASSFAQSILVRKNRISSADLPTAPYIQNIGVQPDRVADLMTTDNLLNDGKPFVSGFSDALVQLVESSR